eukprot:278034-Lingulodinium_polyedra.AAC.1
MAAFALPHQGQVFIAVSPVAEEDVLVHKITEELWPPPTMTQEMVPLTGPVGSHKVHYDADGWAWISYNSGQQQWCKEILKPVFGIAIEEVTKYYFQEPDGVKWVHKVACENSRHLYNLQFNDGVLMPYVKFSLSIDGSRCVWLLRHWQEPLGVLGASTSFMC